MLLGRTGKGKRIKRVGRERLIQKIRLPAPVALFSSLIAPLMNCHTAVADVGPNVQWRSNSHRPFEEEEAFFLFLFKNCCGHFALGPSGRPSKKKSMEELLPASGHFFYIRLVSSISNF